MSRDPIDNIDYYDCSGKPNGNYLHPFDCTRFIMCTEGRAADMACPDCDVSDERCAGSKYLFYDAELDRCEWPANTRCITAD
jgi:Chitin binding Peritrophin-A domain